MSSRELWVFITHLTEKSEFKKILRDGDWDTDKYLSMHIANELKAYRADFASAHGAKMKPHFIMSPAQEQEKAEEDQQRRDVRSMIMGQLRGEYVPPTRDVSFRTEDKRGIPEGGVHV